MKDQYSLNKVILVGRLGKDPEVRYTQNGDAVANFSLATSEWVKDGDARTEWHNIVVWGKTAEFCGKYLQKGALVCVEGRIRTRQWEDKNGLTRKTTEIQSFSVISLSSGKSNQESAQNDNIGDNVDDDEVPF